MHTPDDPHPSVVPFLRIEATQAWDAGYRVDDIATVMVVAPDVVRSWIANRRPGPVFVGRLPELEVADDPDARRYLGALERCMRAAMIDGMRADMAAATSAVTRMRSLGLVAQADALRDVVLAMNTRLHSLQQLEEAAPCE